MIAHNISPDSFVQLAMFTSYFLLYGCCVSQYESVMTKPFLHGRTEAGRSCTVEAKAFAEAWAETAVGIGSTSAAKLAEDQKLAENSRTNIRKLFYAAIKAQKSTKQHARIR